MKQLTTIHIYEEDAEAFEAMAKGESQKIEDFFKLILRTIHWRETRTPEQRKEMDSQLRE